MRLVGIAASALAIVSFPPQLDSAWAQEFLPNRISVDYIEPRSPELQSTYDWLRKGELLEQLAKFLAPLRLPMTLRIWGFECFEDAELLAYYYPKYHAIHLCYEFVDKLAKAKPDNATADGVTPAQAFGGTLVGMLLHETGHAVADMLKVPVFGREEDAADQIAEFVALQFDEELAETVTKGSGWYWLADATSGIMYFNEYADVHSTGFERFLNYLCLGYGRDPHTFKDLAEKYLADRAPNCSDEYRQVEKAFHKTVLPYIDPGLMQQVRSRRWFAPAGFE
jgi:putative metallopeptidase DUF4344